MSIGVELWAAAWWTPVAAILAGYAAPKVTRWIIRYAHVTALRPGAGDLAGLGDRLAGTASVSPERHGGDSTLPRPAGASASHAAQVGRSRAG